MTNLVHARLADASHRMPHPFRPNSDFPAEGQTIDRGSLLQWLASTAGVGKTVTVRVLRSGKPVDLKVTLGQLKEPKEAKPRAPQLRPHLPQGSGDDDDAESAPGR